MSNDHDQIALEIARQFVDGGQRKAQLQVAIFEAMRNAVQTAQAEPPIGYANVHNLNDTSTDGIVLRKRGEFFTVPVYLHPQPAELAEQQVVGITADWVLGYLNTDAPEDSREAIRNAFTEWNALTATGKQQGGEDCTAILSARIALEVELCGSLQRVAKELGIDVGYLSRLARGEKKNPSDEVLEKFGLERTVTYTPIKREYAASPLHPRTKSA